MTETNRENRAYIDSYDTDTEQLAEALKELADTVETGETHIDDMNIDVSVSSENCLRADIQLSVTPSKRAYDSIIDMTKAFNGGDDL